MSVTLDDRPPTVDEYRRLFASTGWRELEGVEPGPLEAALAASHCWVVARSDGACVGMARVVSDGAVYAFLVDVIVDPDHRGRGIGSAIVSELVVKLRTSGLATVQLLAAEGSVRSYERLGFAVRPAHAPGMALVTPPPP